MKEFAGCLDMGKVTGARNDLEATVGMAACASWAWLTGMIVSCSPQTIIVGTCCVR